jgi:hypothetical protein
MRVRQLSPTGDMVFGSSGANFIVDTPAGVAQIVMTSLKLFLGEWYLNVNAGTPYFESIIGYHSQESADIALQTEILSVEVIISSTNVPTGTVPGQSVPAVTGITNWQSSIDPATRAYSASCTINTIYGPTLLQIANYANF